MKRIWIIGSGILVLVLLLAGAAFVGGKLLNGQGLTTLGSPGEGHHPDIQLAKELPQTPPDAEGIFDHRKDNSVFVGTGQVRKVPQTDQSGAVTLSLTHGGPTVEVVVTPQTVVYKNVTVPPPRGSGTITVQEVVEPGTLDEIGENCPIAAWGKKTGDRIIADVLVYWPPPPVNNARP